MRWKSNADVRARPFGAPLRVLVLHSAQVHAREEQSLSMTYSMLTKISQHCCI